MKNTEVELRGPLTADDVTRVEKYLAEHNATKNFYHDLGVFFNADAVAALGTFQTGGGRLQANQKTYPSGKVEQVVKLKLGSASGTEREEHEMRLPEGGLNTFLKIVERFGITQASFRGSERTDYTLGPITMTIKIGHAIGDHFEAEMVNGSKEELMNFLSELKLTPWTEEQFKQTVIESRSHHPYIDIAKGLQENTIL